MYAADKQTSADVVPLKEGDAYPAMPEDGYGWEKLFSERMCRHFREDFGLHDARRALSQCLRAPRHLDRRPREGARGHLPESDRGEAVRAATRSRFGATGKQTRSFMYIDDCLKGTQMILHSDIVEPLNLGSDELVTINQLVDIVEEIAGIKLKRNYDLNAPKGVNGRNSDNTLIKQHLGWAPGIRLREGLEKTYAWIYDQLAGLKHDRTAQEPVLVPLG